VVDAPRKCWSPVGVTDTTPNNYQKKCSTTKCSFNTRQGGGGIRTHGCVTLFSNSHQIKRKWEGIPSKCTQNQTINYLKYFHQIIRIQSKQVLFCVDEWGKRWGRGGGLSPVGEWEEKTHTTNLAVSGITDANVVHHAASFFDCGCSSE